MQQHHEAYLAESSRRIDMREARNGEIFATSGLEISRVNIKAALTSLRESRIIYCAIIINRIIFCRHKEMNGGVKASYISKIRETGRVCITE